MGTRRGRKLAPAILATGLLGLLLFFTYALRSWEWGFLDDLQFVARSTDFTSRFGLWQGIVENTRDHLRGDRTWGLFRPGFSLYSSTVYLLGPNLAYFTRFLTFLGTIAFALLAVNGLLRQARLKPGRYYYGLLLFAILSIHPLYDALGFITLQEYSGLFFAMLGLFLLTRERNTASAWCAAGCFLLAASFKTPFVWLLSAAGVLVFFKRRQLVLGIFCAVTALLDIGVAAHVAKSGAYTSHFTEFNPSLIITTIVSFSKQAAIPLLITAAAFFSGGRRRPRHFYVTDWYTLMLLGAGASYLANLLPWGSPNYHMGPPVFMLVLGLFIFLAPRFEIRPVHVSFPILAAVLSLLVCGHGAWKAVARDVTIQGMRDFALRQPPHGLVLATNGIESAGRFRELLVLRSKGAWENPIVCGTEATTELQDGGETTKLSPDFYFVFSDQGGGNPHYMTKLVAEFPMAKVYQVK